MLRRRTLLAALAGLGLALAFEPVALPWLMPPAIAGFVLTTRGLPAKRAFLVGLAFGAAFYFTHIWWMRTVGTTAWLGLAAMESLFYALMGSLSAVLQRHRLWPLWFAAGWTAVEVWRSGWPFSGMPWGQLVFGVVDTPAAAALPYVGAVGVSFAVALLGALLAWLAAGDSVADGVAEGGRRVAAGCLVGLCALLAVSALLPWDAESAGSVTVAAVQGDVPGNGDNILYDYRRVTQNHVDATVELAEQVRAGQTPRPDFVVWPENSTAVDPFNDSTTNSGIRTASAAIGVPILVGAIVDAGEDNVLNQGIVWDPETGAGDRYTKWHPVAYGEYVPLRRFFDSRNFGRLAEVSRDMLSGTRREPLDIGGVQVGDAICFDVAYDDGIHAQVANGAQLLVVQTSNATFIHTDQIDQQFAMTRLRAIETGRWVAVASTNGVSGIIDPDGRVVATADTRTRAVLVEQLGLIETVTPAVRIGPWGGRAAIGLTGLGLLLVLLSHRRDPGPGGTGPRDSRSEAPEPATVGGPS